MHFLQAINSDISVLIICNKTGGTIKGDIKKILMYMNFIVSIIASLEVIFIYVLNTGHNM